MNGVSTQDYSSNTPTRTYAAYSNYMCTYTHPQRLQFAANHLLVKNISINGLYFGAYRKHDPAAFASVLSDVFKYTAQGKLRPHTPAVYPLDKVNDAFGSIIKRTSVGKVILDCENIAH